MGIVRTDLFNNRKQGNPPNCLGQTWSDILAFWGSPASEPLFGDWMGGEIELGA